MRAGKLRHQITIQKLVAGSPQQKPTGEPDEAWTNHLSNVRAEWITLSGNALFAAQQNNPEVRGIWRIRWRSGIAAKMRVVHGGLYYDILFVPPFDKKGIQWDLDLACAQGVNEG